MHNAVFINSIEHFSYFGIFFFALFSGFIIPIPEEIILLITGYMARFQMIHLTPAIFIIIFAFVIGDNILFRLVLKNNKHVSKLIHEVLSLEIISKKKDSLEKHVGATIFLSRFIPFFRFVGPVFAGYVKASEEKFLLFNTLAICIYAPFVIWIGYFFSEYFSQIVIEMGKVRHVLFILVLVIVGLLISRAVDYFLNKLDMLKL
jgi:membrane protein DedA with SNARE-associated domain